MQGDPLAFFSKELRLFLKLLDLLFFEQLIRYTFTQEHTINKKENNTPYMIKRRKNVSKTNLGAETIV